METKIFGRLTAWQNWIFNRPNAVRPGRRAARVRHRAARRLRPEASLTVTDSRRLHREDPEQRRPARGPAAAARARVVAAELPDLVGVDGPDAADPGRLPAYRGQRRPRGLGALRPRRRCTTTGGASSWPSATRDRRIGFGEHKGEPAWQKVPGEYRAELQRLIVIQGDTEPASVEQQRNLGRDRAQPVRPAQPVPGQRRGGPAPVGDGLPAARLLRPGGPRGGRGAAAPQLRQRGRAAHPGRVQRGDARTGCRSSCSPTSPTGTASTSSAR